ncbi:MAG: hypothetical protein HY940_06880 [Gammaproteobacteria bacterium]|nr:hypothetical protein [Gammaproteobacteria bacterium]
MLAGLIIVAARGVLVKKRAKYLTAKVNKTKMLDGEKALCKYQRCL